MSLTSLVLAVINAVFCAVNIGLALWSHNLDTLGPWVSALAGWGLVVAHTWSARP